MLWILEDVSHMENLIIWALPEGLVAFQKAVCKRDLRASKEMTDHDGEESS